MYLRESDRLYALLTCRKQLKMPVTDEQLSALYQDALDLLGNLAHYYHGRPHEADDVVTVLRALFAQNGVE